MTQRPPTPPHRRLRSNCHRRPRDRTAAESDDASCGGLADAGTIEVGLPCDTSSAWHSGARVFLLEQHWETRSLSAHQALRSTPRQGRRGDGDRLASKRAGPAAYLGAMPAQKRATLGIGPDPGSCCCTRCIGI